MGTQSLSETQSAVEVPTSDATGVETLEPVVDAPSSRVVPTRASRSWVKVLPGLILVAIIIMFVLQNLKSTKVSFVTASGSFPLALALLGAAALGALCVLALGSVRILQLRKVIRHTNHQAK
jgi:uncharacterized integral membrane protein